MWWLVIARRPGAIGSAALRVDAAQSALCAYLSLIALAGLATNAIWRVAWADPIAALVVSAAHRLGGSGSHAWEDLRLLLVSPRTRDPRSVMPNRVPSDLLRAWNFDVKGEL